MSYTGPERRLHRMEPPRCQSCATAAAVSVVSRTDDIVYFRCETCGWRQSLWKPFRMASAAIRARRASAQQH